MAENWVFLVSPPEISGVLGADRLSPLAAWLQASAKGYTSEAPKCDVFFVGGVVAW